MRSREEQQLDRREAFGDAVYEVWMRGGDYDTVNREEVDDVWYEEGERDRHITSQIVADRTMGR